MIVSLFANWKIVGSIVILIGRPLFYSKIVALYVASNNYITLLHLGVRRGGHGPGGLTQGHSHDFRWRGVGVGGALSPPSTYVATLLA